MPRARIAEDPPVKEEYPFGFRVVTSIIGPNGPLHMDFHLGRYLHRSGDELLVLGADGDLWARIEARHFVCALRFATAARTEGEKDK